eukprot:m.1474547 g.1474547  ORF g.1474547 m.1474547 type:complete len:1157 (+) comp25154_c0_seq1:406-3876(+)
MEYHSVDSVSGMSAGDNDDSGDMSDDSAFRAFLEESMSASSITGSQSAGSPVRDSGGGKRSGRGSASLLYVDNDDEMFMMQRRRERRSPRTTKQIQKSNTTQEASGSKWMKKPKSSSQPQHALDEITTERTHASMSPAPSSDFFHRPKTAGKHEMQHPDVFDPSVATDTIERERMDEFFRHQPDQVDYARLNESYSTSHSAAPRADGSPRGLHAATDLGNTMDDMAAFGDTLESITVPDDAIASSSADNAAGSAATPYEDTASSARVEDSAGASGGEHASIGSNASDGDNRNPGAVRANHGDSKYGHEDVHDSGSNTDGGVATGRDDDWRRDGRTDGDDAGSDGSGDDDLDATIVMVAEPDDDATPQATPTRMSRHDPPGTSGDPEDTSRRATPTRASELPVTTDYDERLATPALAGHAPRPTTAPGRSSTGAEGPGLSDPLHDPQTYKAVWPGPEADASENAHAGGNAHASEYQADDQPDKRSGAGDAMLYQSHADSLDLSEETTMMMASAARVVQDSGASQALQPPPRERTPAETDEGTSTRAGTFDGVGGGPKSPPSWAGARAAALNVLYPSTSERLRTMETQLTVSTTTAPPAAHGRAADFPLGVPPSVYDVIGSHGVGDPPREHFDHLARLRQEIQQQEAIIKEYEQENVRLRSKVHALEEQQNDHDNALKAAKDSFTAERFTLRERVSNLETQLKGAAGAISDARVRDLEAKLNFLATSTAEREQDLLRENERLTAELGRTESEKDDAVRERQQADNELSSQKGAAEETREKLENEIEELKAQLAAVSASEQELKEELQLRIIEEATTAAAKKKNEGAEALDSLRQQYESMRQQYIERVAELEAQVAATRAKGPGSSPGPTADVSPGPTNTSRGKPQHRPFTRVKELEIELINSKAAYKAKLSTLEAEIEALRGGKPGSPRHRAPAPKMESGRGASGALDAAEQRIRQQQEAYTALEATLASVQAASAREMDALRTERDTALDAAQRSAEKEVLQQASSVNVELRNKIESLERVIRHLNDRLLQAPSLETLAKYDTRLQERDRQIDELHTQLALAKKHHTPTLLHFERLETKIDELESRLRRRDREIESLATENKFATQTEVAACENKWKRIVAAKQAQVERFRLELDQVLEAIRVLQSRGVKVALPVTV